MRVSGNVIYIYLYVGRLVDILPVCTFNVLVYIGPCQIKVEVAHGIVLNSRTKDKMCNCSGYLVCNNKCDVGISCSHRKYAKYPQRQ